MTGNRIHVANSSGRDTSNSASERETTTQAYPLRYAKEERRGVRRRIAVSRRVAALFLHRFVAPRRGNIITTSSSRLALTEKIARNATRRYLRYGF